MFVRVGWRVSSYGDCPASWPRCTSLAPIAFLPAGPSLRRNPFLAKASGHPFINRLHISTVAFVGFLHHAVPYCILDLGRFRYIYPHPIIAVSAALCQ